MAGSIVQTVRKTKADGLDFYPTQPWPTRAFMDIVKPQGLVWEPACGGGHMAEVIRETNHVLATDIHHYGYVGHQMLMDFIRQEPQPALEAIEWIITNPPFQNNLTEKFALKAIEMAPNSALLCRLSWLEGSRRYESLFQDNPPSRILVLSERLGFVEAGCEVGRNGMVQYAWYVWERHKKGQPTELGWIPPGSKDKYTLFGDHAKYNGAVVNV